jgi:hypothetical protein
VTDDRFLTTLSRVFGEVPAPPALNLLQAFSKTRETGEPSAAAKIFAASVSRLSEILSSETPVADVLGLPFAAITDDRRRRSATMLGQLLLGRAAETVFEETYHRKMPEKEFELVDLRESRTDTDYRILNGQRRPIYRINIKFHGTRFRRAPELVGLDPHDCFALATYKIFSALEKQHQDRLPYFFAIVGDPESSALRVAEMLADDTKLFAAWIAASAKVKRKRDIEDRIIDQLIESASSAFSETSSRISKASWYVLSARRADRLLREKLFDRVFALRIPGFARQFRGAELDMHFSQQRPNTP